MKISTTKITILGLLITVGTTIFTTLITADRETLDIIRVSGMVSGMALLIWAAYRKEPDDAHLRP